MKRALIITSCLCLAACNVHTNYGSLAYRGQNTGLFSFLNTPQQPQTRFAQVDPAQAPRRAAENARREALSLKAQLQSSQNALASNRAWQDGTCVKPALRDVPPKPKQTISDEEIRKQSIGHCLDLSARRMSSRQLYEALYSANMDEYWVIYQHWQKFEKASCARISRSLTDDWVATNLCGVVGKMGVWACVQDMVEACIQQASNNCRASIINWERDVATIKREPETLLQQCQSSLETIENAKQRIPQMEMEATLNEREYQNIMHSK
ncbi:hypothetical protein GC177_00515 [bacterium]|nr:hypothetical protein [bacterium]